MPFSQDIAAATQLAAGVTNTISPSRLAPCQVARLLTALEQISDASTLDSIAADHANVKTIHEIVVRCAQNIHAVVSAPAKKLPSGCRFFWPQEVEEQLRPDVDELERQLETLRQSSYGAQYVFPALANLCLQFLLTLV